MRHTSLASAVHADLKVEEDSFSPFFSVRYDIVISVEVCSAEMQNFRVFRIASACSALYICAVRIFPNPTISFGSVLRIHFLHLFHACDRVAGCAWLLQSITFSGRRRRLLRCHQRSRRKRRTLTRLAECLDHLAGALQGDDEHDG